MKLVKQTTLFLRQGGSDKVYEIDLCEVEGSRYLVNFRHGRPGSPLQEGTKTLQPVPLEAAEKAFAKLVQSQVDKGYTTGASSDKYSPVNPPQATELVDAEIIPKANHGPRESRILQRLAEGNSPKNRWKLSRAIWRAGELGLVAAEPMLHNFVGIDPMTNYSIAWTMGRLEQSSSANVLKKLAADTSNPHVAQMATEALRQVVSDAERTDMINRMIESLPSPLNAFLQNDSGQTFQETFLKGLGKELDANLLNALYFIDSLIARETLIQALKQSPLEPPFFRPIRRIFKAAEMRCDGQIFGLLSHRFETTKSTTRIYPYQYWGGRKKPTQGEDATAAFSSQTRKFLRGRSWRTLKRLGEDESGKFVPMAVGILLTFSDADANPVRTEERYDWKLRQFTHVHRDVFGSYWAFNQLLYRHSPRFRASPSSRTFQVAPNFETGSPHPGEKEEAFPQLWRQQPKGLLHLLTDSKCRPVHEFAARAIRDCQDFCESLPLGVVKLLLASDYEITVEFGIELAITRYDENEPDFELVLLLANCPLEKGRVKAISWIEAKRNLFFGDMDFAHSILTSPYEDTRRLGKDSLYTLPNDPDQIRILVGKLLLFLQAAKPSQVEIVSDVGEAIMRPELRQQVRTLGEDVLCDLLSSEVNQVQMIAGSLVSNHATLSQSPTEKILRAMLDATHAPVRAMGIKIISGLPDPTLTSSVEMLAGLTCHPLEDIRTEVRPLVQRLVQYDSSFAKSMATELIRRLLTPGAPERVPTHCSRVVREDLVNFLAHIPADTVWKLLQSRSAPAQEVGGFLLPTNIQSSSLQVSEMVKLSKHSILLVRQASWKMYEDNLHRLKTDLATAVRILDSEWEDSRQFGFRFFKEKLDERDLTPEVLISICDSVRPDVQQFGREMITREFKKEAGPEYLMKLSEHPTANVQLFVTNFLNEYAAGQRDRIIQLAPYFVSILSRVNQSRVAKDRVLEFLKSESLKDVVVAKSVGEILSRISATCAIGDRAQTIEAMLEIHQAFPDIALPITLKKAEAR